MAAKVRDLIQIFQFRFVKVKALLRWAQLMVISWTHPLISLKDRMEVACHFLLGCFQLPHLAYSSGIS